MNRTKAPACGPDLPPNVSPPRMTEREIQLNDIYKGHLRASQEGLSHRDSRVCPENRNKHPVQLMSPFSRSQLDHDSHRLYLLWIRVRLFAPWHLFHPTVKKMPHFIQETGIDGTCPGTVAAKTSNDLFKGLQISPHMHAEMLFNIITLVPSGPASPAGPSGPCGPCQTSERNTEHHSTKNEGCRKYSERHK